MLFFALKKFRVAVIILMPLMLLACGTSGDKNASEELSADEMAENANQLLSEGKYAQASDVFEELERLYPYSSHANEAQLKSAIAMLEDGSYDEALLALERFIQLHPGSDKLDYAYYLRAMCYYERIADVRRDQEITLNALEAFEAVIRRFPDSKYSRDAKFKLDLVLDHLAGKEMEIGRYYLYGGHINSAITRFLNVVRQFQTTTHVPEALYRLVEAYLTIGLKDEAMRTASVLGHNYPGSKWYEKAYSLLSDEERKHVENSGSWLSRTFDEILGN